MLDANNIDTESSNAYSSVHLLNTPQAIHQHTYIDTYIHTHDNRNRNYTMPFTYPTDTYTHTKMT
jgi:hypothetical protein